jgi:hypothetical protein
MTRRVLLAGGVALVMLFVGTWPAEAVKTQIDVTPANLKHVEGLTVAAEWREDGRVRFTIRRDPAKARWQLRTGDLTIGHGADTVVDCSLHGRKRPGGILEYQFIVSAEALPDAQFVLREVQGSEDDEEQIIGGGEFYNLRLVDFAPERLGL